MTFLNRRQAGAQLAMHLAHTAPESPVVVALAPSGVETALEVAASLNAPLSPIAVHEVRFADDPLIVLGAVSEFDSMVIDASAVEKSGLDAVQIETLFARSAHTVADAARLNRAAMPRPDVEGRTVILIDDGAVHPTKLRAALETPYLRSARRVVVAVPVATPAIEDALGDACSEYVAVEVEPDLQAVGLVYREYAGPTEADLERFMAEASQRHVVPTSPAAPGSACVDQELRIPLADIALEAHLNVPDDARAIVIVVHGHDSNHRSEANRSMVRRFNEGLFGTMDVDLFAGPELSGETSEPSIDELGRRLTGVRTWLSGRPDCGRYRQVVFTTGSSAAAAIVAGQDSDVAAVAAWAPRLSQVDHRTLSDTRIPTLLIMGEHDHPARRSVEALGTLPSAFRTEVLPGIDHVLDERHERSAVATRALRWFDEHLSFEPASGGRGGHHNEGATS